ncbi:MAG: tyrosine-type recombinase/integrase [Sphaerochaeta sp.]|uniref:tyrosine-type recombinase/integrase n=1 Tax=uncultured Sphaerochaeta sp. TaxID=886478 RepID=UPI000B2FF631|nr:tyrosine-type recombinase/integrase [uncultured Sphaerochaeta sp.]MEA4866771.1 tyrosine-type recombinase/integrase [Sphaerochaeta sp.]
MQLQYNSVFSKEIMEYIDSKRALGCKYDSESLALRRIDRFLVGEGLTEKSIPKDVCMKWCSKRSYEKQCNFHHRASIMRGFTSYLVDMGFTAFVPPMNMVGKGPRYDAHIYTEDELRRFFAAVDTSISLPSECPYRGQVMPVFFRILYTSGMRVSELRLLQLQDMHEDECYLTVRNGKNNKDRIVPIHPELASRCAALRLSMHQTSPPDEFFFMKAPGKAMTLQNLYNNFRRYLEKADIPHTGEGPRIHDFRWTYCVNRLRKWVEEGKELHSLLPFLKTMLGHETFDETAYYLKLTEELFPIIMMKLKYNGSDIIEEVDDADFDYN